MTRPLLSYLHHRRFRLLVRWKTILLSRDAFRVPHVPVFPHRLVIEVFEEIVHLLKCAAAGHAVEASKGRPIILAESQVLTADQYAEILWAGREVLIELVDGEACAERFGDVARRGLHANLQRIFVGLVEREIRELHRLEAERTDAMMVRRQADDVEVGSFVRWNSGGVGSETRPSVVKRSSMVPRK